MNQTIGKNSDNNIVIANDPTVSRIHAELIFENEEIFIKDLGSLNGTYINGIKISGKKKINQLDVVKIGNSILNWTNYLPESYNNTIMSSDSKTVLLNSTKSQIKTDMFVMTNGKFFESHKINVIRERLVELDDSKLALLNSVQFKDPTTVLIVSLLAGGLGIDRFMIGDTGLGIGKLLTCGGGGIWSIVDLFMIQKATRQKNMEKIQQFLM